MSTIQTIQEDIFNLLPNISLNGVEIVKQTFNTPDPLSQHFIEMRIYDKTWMNNMVSRDISHEELYRLSYGDVLLAGLGLGGDLLLLKDNPVINSISVVDNNQDVIELVWTLVSQDDPRFSIFNQDIIAFLNQTSLSFDTIWLDTFVEQGFEIPDEIYSLMSAAQYRLNPGGVILAWRDPQNNSQGEI